MINHEKKFIFIHIPKTGGSSIVKFFRDNNIKSDSTSGFPHRETITPEIIEQNYYVFAFHRNPWDRMVSLWKYWTKINVQKNTILQHYPESISFPGFCYNLRNIFIDLLPRLEKIHVMNQCLLNGHSKDLNVTFWGRFSHLEDDFKIVCDTLNIPFNGLPKINRSKHKDYKEYYDDNLKQFVAKLYEQDIDTFKYTFDN